MPINTNDLFFLMCPPSWRSALNSGRLATANQIVLHNLEAWPGFFDRRRMFQSMWQSAYPFWDVLLTPLHPWLIDYGFVYSPAYGYLYQNMCVSALSYMGATQAIPRYDSQNYRIHPSGVPYPQPGELDEGQFQIAPEVSASLDVYVSEAYIGRGLDSSQGEVRMRRVLKASVDFVPGSYYYGETWVQYPSVRLTWEAVTRYIDRLLVTPDSYLESTNDESLSSLILPESRTQAHVRKGRQTR